MKLFECEMERPNKKLMAGYEMKKNADLPASELTLKNQFKKLNFTHYTPNTIKIRQVQSKSKNYKKDMNSSVEMPINDAPEIRMSLQA